MERYIKPIIDDTCYEIFGEKVELVEDEKSPKVINDVKAAMLNMKEHFDALKTRNMKKKDPLCIKIEKELDDTKKKYDEAMKNGNQLNMHRYGKQFRKLLKKYEKMTSERVTYVGYDSSATGKKAAKQDIKLVNAQAKDIAKQGK